MGQAQKKNYWRFPDDFLGKEKIIKKCKFWKWSLNFGKVTEPPKTANLGGIKFFWTPKKILRPGIGCAMSFLQKKNVFFVKCGLGSRSNILLPRIGGSHPVPSLSILSTERRGTAMYYGVEGGNAGNSGHQGRRQCHPHYPGDCALNSQNLIYLFLFWESISCWWWRS